MAEDHLTTLHAALDRFEEKLAERWRQKVYDCVRSGDPIPPNLHRSGASGSGRETGYLDDKNTVPNHTLPEVRAHVTYGQEFGGCAYLNWHEDGHQDGFESVVCPGTIREDPGDAEKSVWWIGDQPVDVPERIDCPVGEIFLAARTWAWQDRTDIYYMLPRFADQDMDALRDAFDALAGMAGEFGGTRDGDGIELHAERELPADVEWLSTDGELTEESWRVDWTGTASQYAADGIYASTLTTMNNHAALAGGLAQLVNMRAMIIKRYRKNTLNLIGTATDALGATSEDTTGLAGLWETVDFAAMVTGFFPQTAAASAPLTIAAFLGEKFMSVGGTEVSYTYEPGEVAVTLYDDFRKVQMRLAQAEVEYEDKANRLRADLNQIPSTYLELYDLTENSPTGIH